MSGFRECAGLIHSSMTNITGVKRSSPMITVLLSAGTRADCAAPAWTCEMPLQEHPCTGANRSTSYPLAQNQVHKFKFPWKALRGKASRLHWKFTHLAYDTGKASANILYLPVGIIQNSISCHRYLLKHDLDSVPGSHVPLITDRQTGIFTLCLPFSLPLLHRIMLQNQAPWLVLMAAVTLWPSLRKTIQKKLFPFQFLSSVGLKAPWW